MQAIEEAAKAEGAMYEIVAPHVAGTKLSDGERLEADQKIDGAPSAIYDAVAIMMSAESGETMAEDKPSQDFASDAFAHAKFIAYTETVLPLFEAVGIAGKIDDGVDKLSGDGDAKTFVERCRKLHFWDRQAVKQA